MKRKKIKLLRTVLVLTTLILAGLNQFAFAQNYTRTTFSGGFTNLVSGAPGVTTTTISGSNDEGYTNITLPFSFTYYGTTFTTSQFLVAGTNGLAQFSTTAATAALSAANNNLSTITAPNNVVAPYWDDITTNQILWQVSGVAPNRVFTIQWNGLTYFSTSTRNVSFQTRFYETTNVIELVYGPAPSGGTFSTSESASIGIKNATGGANNFIDAITGSSNASNGMVTSNKWPRLNYRFTPGAPTAIAAGTYNVGTTGTYTTLTEAIADVNHRGIAGAVTLNLVNNIYDSTAAGGLNFFPLIIGNIAGASATNTLTITKIGTPATLNHYGTASGNISNAASSSALSTTSEPIIGLVGSDFVTINNLTLNGNYPTSTNRADRGIMVLNNSVTDGANSNTFTNLLITLDRTNTSSVGIVQQAITTPTAAGGANSNNVYRNFRIYNAYSGVNLVGNASFPDLNTIIGTTANNIYNEIGNESVANDIGNGSVAVYGIQASNQSGFNIFNNRIINLTHTGSSTLDGIVILTFVGTCNLYNNFTTNLRNSSTTATSGISGIRLTHTITGTHNIRVYNNVIHSLSSGYTGTASATRQLRGIFISGTGGTTMQTYNILYNSVFIDGTAAPNISSICFEHSTSAGPVYVLRNNLFVNNTGAQTGIAKHHCIMSTSATVFGATGSSTNNNSFFVANTTNGFVGLGSATDYASLANWQTALTQDANSISGNPTLNSNTMLAPQTGSTLVNAGTPQTSITTVDILNNTRSATSPTIGAYELAGDFSLPSITYTPLTNQAGLTNPTLTSFAAITDAISGVNVTSGTAPRLYFKKQTEANVFGANNSTFNGWKWVEATGASSPYSFTIDYSILNTAVAIGDVIQYFVVAQDLAATPNVACNPSVGFVGTSVANITTAPTSPNSYIVVNAPMVGTYLIGSSQTAPNYTTITSAINDLNTRGISGAVNLVLTDATYGASETFPITVGVISGASSTQTITMLPASGVNATISGTANAIFRLNGTDFFQINGSNNNSNSRNLSIINNSTAANSAAIWISSLGANAGATFDTIRNCIIKAGTTGTFAAPTYGIIASGNTMSTSATGADNDNNVIINNTITRATIGIFYWSTTIVGEANTGINISRNIIGSGTERIYTRGIWLQNTQGEFSFNQITNIEAAGTDFARAFELGTNVINSTFNGNVIHAIANNTSNFRGGQAFFLNTGATNANIVISNNSISGLRGHASGTFVNNTWAFYLSNGSGYTIVYNSVNIPDNRIVSTSTDVSGGLYVAAAVTAIDFRNNSISITGAPGNLTAGKMVGIYSLATASAFTFCNYNNIYVSGSRNFVGFINAADQIDMAAWRTASLLDANSISIDPIYNASNTLIPYVGSPNSAAGVAISITNDILNVTRSITAPTIGAYENVGDFAAPQITISNLIANTGASVSSVNLTADITDLSGVDGASGTRPRVYYRKISNNNALNGNTNADNGWKFVEASNSTSPFSFTLQHNLLFGGLSVNDTIQYFVIAQDLAGTPNVGSSSTIDAFTLQPASVALTNNNFPYIGSLFQYRVLPPLPTTFNIPGDLSSFTNPGGLFDSINRSFVNSDITINITGDVTGETGAIALNQFSSTNTLTIRPASSGLKIISGSPAILMVFNGADNIVIDGTFNGIGNNLLFRNNNSGTTSVGLLFNAIGNNGCQNVNINAITVESGSTNLSGGTSVINMQFQGEGHGNITIDSSVFRKSYTGLVIGAGTVSAPYSGVVVSNNLFGSSVPAEFLTANALTLLNTSGAVVSRNRFTNLTTNLAINNSTITVGAGNQNTLIQQNLIEGNRSVNTGLYGTYGIQVTAGSGIIIRNNIIRNLYARIY